jgi:cellobiose phosphorylase
MLFTVPMIYIEPRLAREMLEYTLRLMASDGRIPYMTNGFGMTGGAIVHKNPSDLSLFLLWGLSEYLFATRDFKFLNKSIPFYPKSSGSASTVYEHMKLAVDFLLDEVGFGEHGLIRVGDGDWNDGISTMVRNRGKFIKSGESMFNSAFALYVLPRISLLFEKYQEKHYSDLIEKALKNLHEACLKSWNGKWFYRGWDGSGNPIGNESIFLEPLTWLLISGALPEEYANKLIESVFERLDDPSPFGQNLVSPPVRTMFDYLEKGWDVNGGIWYAINFLLSWGYSKYDSQKALGALIKNSMHQHEGIYPDVWYGIWSGPDAFNASYASRPGETYYHVATPTTDFPVMNLNLHANFLTALLKLSGIEPTIDGLTIAPRLPLRKFGLKTPIIELRVDENEIQGSYVQQDLGELTLRVQLPHEWIGKEVHCFINEFETQLRIIENLAIGEVHLESKDDRFKFRLSSSP